MRCDAFERCDAVWSAYTLNIVQHMVVFRV